MKKNTLTLLTVALATTTLLPAQDFLDPLVLTATRSTTR